MRTIYLVVWHDRHTDDKYSAFADLDIAKAQAYMHLDAYPKDRYTFKEIEAHYGDWCLYCSDDYYIVVEAIELIEE